MSVAKDIFKYISSSIAAKERLGDEYFVEVAKQYPHLHATKDWLGFSRSHSGSNNLVKGDTIYWSVIDQLQDDEAVRQSPSLGQVLLFIDQTYER